MVCNAQKVSVIARVPPIDGVELRKAPYRLQSLVIDAGDHLGRTRYYADGVDVATRRAPRCEHVAWLRCGSHGDWRGMMSHLVHDCALRVTRSPPTERLHPVPTLMLRIHSRSIGTPRTLIAPPDSAQESRRRQDRLMTKESERIVQVIVGCSRERVSNRKPDFRTQPIAASD